MTVQSLLGQVDNSTTATDNCQMECVEGLSYQRRLCFEVGFLIPPRSQELTSIFRVCVFCFSTPEGLGEDLTGVKKNRYVPHWKIFFFLFYFCRTKSNISRSNEAQQVDLRYMGLPSLLFFYFFLFYLLLFLFIFYFIWFWENDLDRCAFKLWKLSLVLYPFLVVANPFGPVTVSDSDTVKRNA